MDIGFAGLRLRRELVAAGLSDDDLGRRCRAGGLVRVRRGAYVPPDEEREREARHALATCAALRQVPAGAVASHVSAAVLLGLPVWGIPLDRVHLTRPGVSGGHRRATLQVHVSPLPPDEITTAGEVLVTSVARTLADLARTLPFDRAVPVIDAALCRQQVDRAALEWAIDRAPRRHGVRVARRAVAFADAGAQSVGESRSRVLLDGLRVPTPVLQFDVPARRWVGFADFGWPELRTVGEFDGRVKYGRLLRPGQSPSDAVFAEKRREDAIRDAGFRVVRWVWDELDDFPEVAGRLWDAFRAA